MSVDPFPPNSRYFGVETATWTAPDGRELVFLRRRFVPAPERLGQVGEVVVAQGDRLDVLAFQELGDAELAWRICDANRAMRPAELTETIGRHLRLTLPEEIPVGPGA
jgi:hypothetical protein